MVVFMKMILETCSDSLMIFARLVQTRKPGDDGVYFHFRFSEIFLENLEEKRGTVKGFIEETHFFLGN